MKRLSLNKKGLKRLAAVLLTVLALWGSAPAFAEGDKPAPGVTPPLQTYINLKASGVVVSYSASPEVLDKMVYDSLAISVLDENNQKINFDRGDIALSYNRSPGDQKVTVTFKGRDS